MKNKYAKILYNAFHPHSNFYAIKDQKFWQDAAQEIINEFWQDITQECIDEFVKDNNESVENSDQQ